ncbi:hypothetical protein ACM66B_001835 [Microbotryomycetes sp. NB124-2]
MLRPLSPSKLPQLSNDKTRSLHARTTTTSLAPSTSSAATQHGGPFHYDSAQTPSHSEQGSTQTSTARQPDSRQNLARNDSTFRHGAATTNNALRQGSIARSDLNRSGAAPEQTRDRPSPLVPSPTRPTGRTVSARRLATATAPSASTVATRAPLTSTSSVQTKTLSASTTKSTAMQKLGRGTPTQTNQSATAARPAGARTATPLAGRVPSTGTNGKTRTLQKAGSVSSLRPTTSTLRAAPADDESPTFNRSVSGPKADTRSVSRASSRASSMTSTHQSATTATAKPLPSIPPAAATPAQPSAMRRPLPTLASVSRPPASGVTRVARRAGPRESTTLDEMVRQSCGRKVSSVFAQDASQWMRDADDDDHGIGSNELRKSVGGGTSLRRLSSVSTSGPPRSRNVSATTMTSNRSSATPARVTKALMPPPPPPPSTMKQQREEEARLRKQLEDKLEEMRRTLEASNTELEQMQQERERWDEDMRKLEAEWRADKDRLEAEAELLETEVKGLGRRHQEEKARWADERKRLEGEIETVRAAARPAAIESTSSAETTKRLQTVIAGQQAISMLQLAAARQESVEVAVEAEMDADAHFSAQVASARRQLQAWRLELAVQC